MTGIQPSFLIAYIILPIVLIVVFAIVKPKWLPVSALICLLVNFIVFGMQLLYPETRVMAFSLILVQPAAVFVVSLAVQRLVQEYFPKK